MKYLTVILNSTSGFLILVVALFMFSLAAAAYTYFEVRFMHSVELATALFGVFSVTNLFLLRHVAFIATGVNVSESYFLSLLPLLIISAPYFFAGISVVGILRRAWNPEAGTSSFQSKYLWDMAGITAAAFLPHLLVQELGPEKLMALGLVPLMLCLRFFIRRIESASCKIFISLLLLFVVTFQVFTFGWVATAEPMNALIAKFKPSNLKPKQLEYSQWDPIARLDVVDFSAGNSSRSIKYLFYDGGTIGSNIYFFDGNYKALKENYPQDPKKYFLRRATVASHLLKENTSAEVFLFGVGAGQELKAALMYGASKVYANELVKSVIDLNAGKYSAQNGGIFNDPRVTVLAGDGRLQLHRSGRKFDTIQIFSNYLSANMASGLAPHMITYLFTEESLGEYMNHLKPNGILQINQFGIERVLALIQKNWIKNGPIGDLKKQVYVIKNNGSADIDTLLFKNGEFTPEENQKLKWLFYESPLQKNESYEFLESPFQDSTASISSALTTDATDDVPYFTYTGQTMMTSYGLNPFMYFFILGAGLTASLAYLYRKRSLVQKSKGLHLFFFICGAAFVLLQYALSAKFLKYSDHQDLVYPIVLAAFATSNIWVLKLWPKLVLSWAKIVSLLLISVVLVCAMPAILNMAVLNLSPLQVELVAFTLFILIGLTASLTFPLGSSFIQSKDEFSTAWLVNGAGILTGNFAVHPLALTMGLKIMLLISLVLYAAGFFLLCGRPSRLFHRLDLATTCKRL